MLSMVPEIDSDATGELLLCPFAYFNANVSSLGDLAAPGTLKDRFVGLIGLCYAWSDLSMGVLRAAAKPRAGCMLRHPFATAANVFNVAHWRIDAQSGVGAACHLTQHWLVVQSRIRGRCFAAVPWGFAHPPPEEQDARIRRWRTI